MTKAEILGLPYGSGSGFESPAVHGNGYVFCIKIGTSPKPWFRYVPADDDWAVKYTDEGDPRVSADTLISLRVADPRDADCRAGSPRGVRQGVRRVGGRPRQRLHDVDSN